MATVILISIFYIACQCVTSTIEEIVAEATEEVAETTEEATVDVAEEEVVAEATEEVAA